MAGLNRRGRGWCGRTPRHCLPWSSGGGPTGDASRSDCWISWEMPGQTWVCEGDAPPCALGVGMQLSSCGRPALELESGIVPGKQ